jgi:hypothetical protein
MLYHVLFTLTQIVHGGIRQRRHGQRRSFRFQGWNFADEAPKRAAGRCLYRAMTLSCAVLYMLLLGLKACIFLFPVSIQSIARISES